MPSYLIAMYLLYLLNSTFVISGVELLSYLARRLYKLVDSIHSIYYYLHQIDC